MDKLEKSYYAVIGNKKRGKFSGAGPIQVAKKVASKKLKTGKEMEFYLDEVAGKKKRYGPYQARKDKKSGRVVVVKGRKVMKGGVLSRSNELSLKTIFTDFNNNGMGFNENFQLSEYKNEILPLIPFGREPIIYCCPRIINNRNKNRFYRIAIFKESNGNIYIMIYNHSFNCQSFIEIVNLDDFFLNPKYLNIFTEYDINKKEILESLQNIEIIKSRTISDEIKKIYTLLYIPAANYLTQRVITYVPDYNYPRIRKCVYPDLTFGILDEETRAIIPLNNNILIKPTSFFQKFLMQRLFLE
jgi:hypothetical protein